MTSMKRRGLGKKLDDLLSDDLSELMGEESLRISNNECCNLPINSLHPGRYQPRETIDSQALEDLAHSIRQQGLLQPIVVRPTEEAGGGYEIVAGERRWRAAQLAGLEEVQAIVREIPDKQAGALSLVENVQREDLAPLELARAMARLVKEFSLTHQEVSDMVGKSRAAVSNFLRLLELNEDVQQLLAQGKIEMGHARALLGLHDAEQSKAALEVARKNLTVRGAEALVQSMQLGKLPVEPKLRRPMDPDVIRLQQSLSSKLGAHVELHHESSGKGRLVIRYSSLEELDAILGRV